MTFLRILVTTTEFSPNKEAIRHIEETQAAYIHKAKLELVNVLKREAMRQKVTGDRGTAWENSFPENWKSLKK